MYIWSKICKKCVCIIDASMLLIWAGKLSNEMKQQIGEYKDEEIKTFTISCTSQ